ncbi:MAG: hypothetical protein LBH31_06700 [Burkholderiaceae bacterium]|nr:hypothetical protein [Burkholderiaceae bacterium]
MTQPRFLSRRQALGWVFGSSLGALASSAMPVWAASAAAPASPASGIWPNGKPVKVFAPDGLADNMMQMFLADRIGDELRTNVTTSNLSGQASLAALIKAAPDGLALAFTDTDWLTRVPYLFPASKPYNPDKDFTPVASVFAKPVLLLATPALSARDVPDLPALLAHAKQKPGAIRWATTPGAVSVSLESLILQQIKAKAGVDIALFSAARPVPKPNPYMRTSQAFWSLTGYSIKDVREGKFGVLTTDAFLPVIPHIKSGLLRPLAIAAPARIREELPYVPTLAELGFPGANLFSMYGFLAPADTPPQIVRRLNQVVNTQANDAEVRHHIDAEGLVAMRGSAANFAQAITEMMGYTRAALQTVGTNW